MPDRFAILIFAVALSAGCPDRAAPSSTPSSAPSTSRPVTAAKPAPPAAAAKTASPAELLAGTRAAMAELKSYRATLELQTSLVGRHDELNRSPRKVSPWHLQVTLAVERPSHMVVDLHSQAGARAHIVFDGKTMFARKSMRGLGTTSQVGRVRLDQAKLAAGGFDVGYLSWASLISPDQTTAEPFEVVRQLLEHYRFEHATKPSKLGQGSCLELEGRVSTDVKLAYYLDLPSWRPLWTLMSLGRSKLGKEAHARRVRDIGAKLAKQLRRVEKAWLCLDPQTGLPRRWAVGRRRVSPEMTVTLTKLVAAKLSPETFRIDPKELAKARDMTSQVLEQRKLQRGGADKVLKAELRAVVHEALKQAPPKR